MKKGSVKERIITAILDGEIESGALAIMAILFLSEEGIIEMLRQNDINLIEEDQDATT